jgi:hypothetical protein
MLLIITDEHSNILYSATTPPTRPPTDPAHLCTRAQPCAHTPRAGFTWKRRPALHHCCGVRWRSVQASPPVCDGANDGSAGRNIFNSGRVLSFPFFLSGVDRQTDRQVSEPDCYKDEKGPCLIGPAS